MLKAAEDNPAVESNMEARPAKAADPLELPQQPGDEVLTRRKQFQMKKDKREEKKAKRLEKKAEKEEKEKAKIEKKKEREAQKIANAEAKAKAKLEKQQNKKAEKTAKGKNAEAMQDETAQGRKRARSQDKAHEAEHTEEQVEHQEAHGEEEVWEEEGWEEEEWEEEWGEENDAVAEEANTTPQPEQWKGPLKRGKLSKLRRAKGAKRPKKATKGKPLGKKGSKSRKRPANKMQKTGGSIEESNPKRSRKEPAKTEPKGKGKKTRQTQSPCTKVVNKVRQVLTSCCDSECQHPEWEEMAYDKKVYQISVYWSRMAIGVKVAQAQLKKKGKKASTSGKKNKWSQVAYFSAKTTCIYTNLVLAQEFATGLQEVGVGCVYVFILKYYSDKTFIYRKGLCACLCIFIYLYCHFLYI